MKKFALEFNEKQQTFHHNYGTHEENTNGFVTICKEMTDDEACLFQCFIDDVPFTVTPKYTTKGLIKSFKQFKIFIENMKFYNFKIINKQ